MRLRVLASGSSGNGYILYNDSEALVIECGVQYSSCLKALDFDRSRIVGALVSHSHGDHCGYTSQYLKAAIPVFTLQGTVEGMKNLDTSILQPCIVEKLKVFSVGRFKVFPFETIHDVKDSCGFLINHEEMGSLLFATDTCYLKYKFSGLNHIMLECNYATHILEKNVHDGIVPMVVRNRTMRTHMSLETCISTLRANDLSNVNNVVLLHLSRHNSDYDTFKDAVERNVGTMVTIARPDVDIPINKEM